MVILSHITEINIELTKIIPESLAKILGNVSDRTLSLSPLKELLLQRRNTRGIFIYYVIVPNIWSMPKV